MNLFRSLLLVLSAPFLLNTACQNSDKAAPQSAVSVDSVATDSDALVLALTPTVESLPLYYAHHAGIFKTLGLKVSVKTFTSQFDCDTAMIGTTAIGGVSDLVRMHLYANEGKRLSVVTALDGQWSLMVSAGLRIKKTQLLENRMISVARHSASDYWSKLAVNEVGLGYEEVLRPQVNDYYLRTAMLNNNQIDAAILPEPYVTKAKLAGHRSLFQTSAKMGRTGCLAFKPEVLLARDSADYVKAILKGYNIAVDDLNKKGKPVCREILLREYDMSPQVLDSLVLPKYQKASMPTAKEIQNARDFLENQERWTLKATPEFMFNAAFIPQK